MEILITSEPVSEETLGALAREWHESLVKGVADVETGKLALGGEWHMDANTKLIETGSEQQNVWGFNIYPNEKGDAAIEYVSLINIRPRQNNRSMEIADEGIRTSLRDIARRIIPFLDL